MEKEDELKSIFLKENINVWSENQSTLEEQALKELEIVAKENSEKQNIEQKCMNIATVSLDINSYIEQQQNLKKRQDFNRSLNEVKSTKIIKKRQKVDADIDIHNNLMVVDNEELHQDKFESDNESIEIKSGSEYVPSDLDCDSDNGQSNTYVSQKQTKRKRTQNLNKTIDDGNLENYKSRLDIYYKKLEDEELLKRLDGSCNENVEYHMLKGGLKVAINIWNKLYEYQQDSIKWLWKLHTKNTGGLLGDEMGLGKTVQIIAFLHSLEYSRISSCSGRFIGLGPSLIVCPATVIHQWVKHFQEWAPEFRVAILHQSGSFQGNKATLIKEMHKSKGIIITTYLGVIKYQNNLLDYNWHYVILDEGHKIRNPSAKATVAIKLLRTPHRLMLTGSPMQNDLTELWSLLDFTNTGLLGNLKTFQEHFSTPILHGGFSNSTPMQEATALSVASILKDLISPYLLRRTKQEVQHHILLPNKTEQVLFCSLSEQQKLLYKEYLMGDDVSNILGKGVKNWAADNHIRARVFVAITKLRKICNHPDIYLSDTKDNEEENIMSSNVGNYKKSGKMIVVSALLKIWKREGHRVLLFTQTRSMIRIFQDFLDEQSYKYLKMDGTTSISSRQPMIQTFNTDSSYYVFLLTTRVGGLGVNLTGADRVIIYDPDWNPATDTQARERAWRIGQDKQVTIYRLLAAGTIEEKMYQRQVWKQLLSNKILVDPATNKFFKSSDLFDLFSLQENNQDTNPETVNIFHKSRVRIQEKLKEKKSKSKKSDAFFSEDKIQQMKLMAQQIAKSLTKKPTNLQIELNAEKMEKQEELEEMKSLEVGELLRYNKEKETCRDEDAFVNKIDDYEAVVGFSDALEYSEKTAKLHNNLKSGKEIVKIVEDVKKAKQSVTKTPDKLIKKFKKRKKDRSDLVVDTSGKVGGEKIEGLVKREIKKNRGKHKTTTVESKQQQQQDDFILGKLFEKKGVFGAVQHDSVIQECSRTNNLKIRTEAKMKAEQSLEALRKSRLHNWKW